MISNQFFSPRLGNYVLSLLGHNFWFDSNVNFLQDAQRKGEHKYEESSNRQKMTSLAQELPAVQVIDLVKRYSGRSGTILGAYQIKSIISLLRGKQERNVLALDKLSFSLSKGQIFGLLGPNGAGKTTLIKILSTLVLPDSGRAIVDGVDVVKKPAAALRKLQTVLAESVGFERRLTGRQNLEFYSALYGISKNIAKPRIEELLSYFKMSEKADILFQKYSTGMARKLLICRALLSEAPIILFDEPTSGLDPFAAAEFRKLLSDVLAKERGKTVLLSTHNLHEAEQICDTIAVLKRGKLTAIGTPSEIRHATGERIQITLNLLLTPKLINDLADRIRLIDGVVSLDFSEATKTGTIIASLEAVKDINFNRLFETLIGMNAKILSLEASAPSLEEAFFKLTTEAITP